MPNLHAVLINGSDEEKYHDNIQAVYGTLLDLGFRRGSIHVLDRPKSCRHSYPIDHYPTKAAIRAAFSRLQREVRPDDTLVVHVDDHGELITIKEKDVVGIVLRNPNGEKEYLTEVEFKEMLDGVNPKLTVVTTDICYGGRLARRIGRGKGVGISACGSDEGASTGYGGNSFSHYFYSALTSSELMRGDGAVSVKDAFQHASIRYRTNDRLWLKLIEQGEPIPTPHIFSQVDPARVTI